MSNEITLCKAYRIARKFFGKNMMGEAQYHLSAIGERDDVWVISFFPFIPDPLYTRFLSYSKCELSGITGSIPYYYDSNPKWIEINKSTGKCRRVTFMGYEWIFGEGKEYAESLVWSQPQRVFAERAGMGKGYTIKKGEKISSCYDQKKKKE